MAVYRASADFVPPDIEIKPSKKRRTPRKSPNQAEPSRSPGNSKTPSSSKQKVSVSKDSESDSDELIPPKRVCKALSFNSENCIASQTVSSRKSVNVKSRRKPVSSSSGYNKLTAENLIKENKKNSRPNCKSVSNMRSAKNNVQKLTVGGLASCEEESLRQSSSASSVKVSTVTTSKVDNSDHEFESMTGNTGSACGLKLTDIVQMKSLNSVNPESDKVINYYGTANKTTDEDLFGSCRSEPSSPSSTDLDNNMRGESCSLLPTADHCNTMSITAEETKTVKILRNERSTLSAHSSCGNENDYTDDKFDTSETVSNLIEAVSSSEVCAPSKNKKKHLLFSASSSDSDLSLFASTQCRTVDKSNDLIIVGKESGRDPFKESNHDPKGKLKAGKILRATKKSPICLNTPLEKTILIDDMCSDTDVDSLKSFLSKGSSSLVPSNDTSLCSKSAVSTDEWTPSTGYSSTSSEMSSKTTDSSYLESVDTDSARHKSRNTPAKSKTVRKPVLSQSDSNSGVSSSDISKKEEVLFGKKRRTPLKIKSPRKTSFSNNVTRDSMDSEGEFILGVFFL